MVRVEVRAHPGAARARLEWDGRVARVWVTAAAAEGAANRAVVAGVAEWLGVPPTRVVLLRGHRGRAKLLEVEGVDSLPAAPGVAPVPTRPRRR